MKHSFGAVRDALRCVREPQACLAWSTAQWEWAVRVLRRARLLARLAEALQARDLLKQVPAAPERHLRAELALSRSRTQITRWAATGVAAALAGADYPIVLLKGGAYLAQALPIAAGRLPSDLDILVPHAHLTDAQTRLEAMGWDTGELDEEDRRYYLEWSHEVPPMRHPVYAVELDLHHNILPPVARLRVDVARLLERIQPSPWPGWSVFQPVDQVLHCAVHLLADSEPRDRVRDLVDLDGMLRHFGAEPRFWEQLPQRAQELGLARPMALVTALLHDWLATPMPEPARAALIRQGADAAWQGLERWLWTTLLLPPDPDRLASRLQDAAATFTLARYHLNRLPLRLLLPHLWRKWRMRHLEPGPAPPV